MPQSDGETEKTIITEKELELVQVLEVRKAVLWVEPQ